MKFNFFQFSFQHYFKYGKAENVTHFVIPMDFPVVSPPIKQNPSLLHSCWRQYFKDLIKEEKLD